jgi:hypothetical protein
MLGGALTEFRRFPPTSFAPYGIVVWVEEGEIIAVEIVEPHLPAPIQDQLGAPEAETPSALAAFHTQLIYATRGLALHVHQFRSTVFRLYAFAPTTVADFLASPLAGVATQRTPRF